MCQAAAQKEGRVAGYGHSVQHITKWSVTQSFWKTLESGTQAVSATQEIACKRAAFLRAQQALRAVESMGNRVQRRDAHALARTALASWRRAAWAASAARERQHARCAACLLQSWRCWRQFWTRQARPWSRA